MNNFSKEVSKEKLEEYPLSKYSGEILVIESEDEVGHAIHEINREQVIGIDTETKPSFRKGLIHEVSLLQIATVNRVFLFRINKTGFMRELAQIFESTDLLKIGIAVNDDMRDLQRLRRFTANGIIDLNILAKHLGYESIGAKKLSALILGFRISKKQQTSNWEAEQLSNPQIDYAATDAWICLEIFNRMKEMYPLLPEIIAKKL